MNQEKINHPFHVPDDFFEKFGNEMVETINILPAKRNLKTIVLTISKYAAIIIFSFILGRESVSLYQQKLLSETDSELYTVESVLTQVSDDDIADYLIENATEDVFK
jgi:hypothetical protein